ncbi:hypothetical protein LCGC14_0580270 [marine sediment metagenome]|uniref:histidine kinase n=2 Tax=root TaxID=1 RepID=A0A831VNW7_9FLAO|nr:HAMP domain-containing histidine kinase [Pricia antarctica]
MTTAEAKLKERVKELTCLYEVTSIIVNSDYDRLEASLQDIVESLKRGWQFIDDTEVFLSVGEYETQTENFKKDKVALRSNVKVFNKIDGHIEVAYPAHRYTIEDFLEEEQILLDNVSLAVGSLLERKHIRESEATARRQMEHADRLHILGEITAGIAHELNTPLANILGFAELLKESVRDPANIRDLKKIMDNAIFSREIVKKLMFFACEMPQEMKVVSLKPVIESVVKLLAPSLREKKIKLNTSFNSDSVELRADTVQLTQVLFNIIMNAVYYSPFGGLIHVSVTEIENKICISISDEGSGITAEHADKIFEPFFTTKPIGEGSGLGLSVVHGIMGSHKGVIAHKPNTPKGTIFTVEFPKS